MTWTDSPSRVRSDLPVGNVPLGVSSPLLPDDSFSDPGALMIMRRFIILTVVWTVAASAFAADPVNGPKTALDEYVAKPDPTYEWKVVKTIPGDGVTTFVVDLTSQTWRTPADVDRPVWKHWLTVVKPD